MVDDYEIVKIHWRNLKIFFSRTTYPISTKHATKRPWLKKPLISLNEGPRPYTGGGGGFQNGKKTKQV